MMSLTVRAETAVYGGYVIARNGGIIFVRGAIPEESVEIVINEQKRDYSIGTVINILEPSPYRIKPACPVFSICGGCHLQFISYEKQVSMKEEILLDSMRRIGRIEVQPLPPLTDKDFYYRRRGQFKISQNGEIGFYKESTRDVVPISECPLMINEINTILKHLAGLKLSGLKEIHISYGDSAVALIRPKVITEDIEKVIMDSGILGIAFENGESIGKDYIRLDLNNLKYTITPWSFFQSHWDLNKKVVEFMIAELLPLEGLRILDLYAGAGNLSLPVAIYASEVIAVEENPYAIEDGRRNAMLNNLGNCRFVKSSAERFRIDETFDIIIVDPPRPGLADEVVKKIIKASPKRIIYMSCNPATLARDMKKLNEKYKLDSLRLIDFFPNTYHVEALAFLSLK